MLDIKLIRENLELVKEKLALKSEAEVGKFDLDKILQLDSKKREILPKVEEMKAQKNKVSREIPLKKKNNEDLTETFAEMKKLGEEIEKLENELKAINSDLNLELLYLPNIPDDSVPFGKSSDDNVEVKRVGEVPDFSFEPKAHWDIAESLNLFDKERASKITGSRFTIFNGLGARLERAIYNFMLDYHTSNNGYTEVATPVIVNSNTMMITGKLPKFGKDMYHIERDDSYLISTSEIPLTAMHASEVLDINNLPLRYTAYTTCFRREAGAAGKDTRGLIRLHQFDKVELVNFCTKENSYQELENMLSSACSILDALKLPYRVVNLCTGDLGFTSAKTYDIEVWMPSYNKYVEISSCSNIEDFQSRRANIKYRNSENKLEFVHTLNGSGLAVGRTFAAIIENYQREDGSVEIPEVLVPYMGIKELKSR